MYKPDLPEHVYYNFELILKYPVFYLKPSTCTSDNINLLTDEASKYIMSHIPCTYIDGSLGTMAMFLLRSDDWDL